MLALRGPAVRDRLTGQVHHRVGIGERRRRYRAGRWIPYDVVCGRLPRGPEQSAYAMSAAAQALHERTADQPCRPTDQNGAWRLRIVGVGAHVPPGGKERAEGATDGVRRPLQVAGLEDAAR